MMFLDCAICNTSNREMREVCLTLLFTDVRTSSWGHARHVTWMMSLPALVYFFSAKYSAQDWKSSNTFCLLPCVPPSCHFSPYSPPPLHNMGYSHNNIWALLPCGIVVTQTCHAGCATWPWHMLLNVDRVSVPTACQNTAYMLAECDMGKGGRVLMHWC